MPEIGTFLDELAAGTPVPGGGSVAALEVAMAAGLIAMVANLTMGKRRYAGVEEQARQVRNRANELRTEALRLVQLDSDAYARVSEVLSLPRDSVEERTERTRRMQEALKGAVAPPLRTMEISVEVARLADELSEFGNRSALSDVGTAVLAARAGCEAGRLNVETNLAAIKDVPWVEDVRQSLTSIPNLATLEGRVMQRVVSVIHGETA